MRSPLRILCLCLLGLIPSLAWANQAEDPAVPTATAAEVSTAAETAELGSEQAAPASEAQATPGSHAEHDRSTTDKHDAHAGGAHAGGAHATDGHGDSSHGGAAHGGGHHDPYDLSHQNASPRLEKAEEFKSDLAIWTFVVFLCLLAILSKFAWGPIMEALDRREASIAAMIEDAKQSQEKAAAQLKQYEAKLAAAGEEARAIVVQARKDAESASERILAESRQAADRERQRAVEDITSAKNAALQEITDRSIDLAMSLAGKIVRRELRPEDHSALVREALEKLPSPN